MFFKRLQIYNTLIETKKNDIRMLQSRYDILNKELEYNYMERKRRICLSCKQHRVLLYLDWRLRRNDYNALEARNKFLHEENIRLKSEIEILLKRKDISHES